MSNRRDRKPLETMHSLRGGTNANFIVDVDSIAIKDDEEFAPSGLRNGLVTLPAAEILPTIIDEVAEQPLNAVQELDNKELAELKDKLSTLQEVEASNEELKQKIARLEFELADLRNQHSSHVADLLDSHEKKLTEETTRLIDSNKKQIEAVYDDIRALSLWQVERLSGNKSIVAAANAEDAVKKAKASAIEEGKEKIIGIRSLNEKVII